MIKINTILVISLVLLPIVVLFPQDYKDARVQQLLLTVPELQKSDNYNKLIETLIEIIELKPDYAVPRKMLGGLLSNNFNKIKSDLESNPGLLDKAVLYSIDNLSGSIGAVFLLQKYYALHDREKIREILEKLIMAPYKNDLSSSVLLSFNPKIDKELYNEILQVIISLIDNKSKVNLLIYYYLTHQNDNFFSIIHQTNLTTNPDQLTVKDILKIDPLIDPLNYKLLYPKLMNVFLRNGVLKIVSNDTLYYIGKNYFFCGDKLTADSIFCQVYNNFEKTPSEDYRDLFYWGISCLFKDQQYRAKLIFDQIYKSGDDSLRNFLKQELIWWNDNLFSASYLKDLLFTYFNIVTHTVDNSNKFDSLKTETTHLEGQKIEGTYFALVIGIDEYLDSHISSLFHTVSYAENFASIIKNKFTFDEKNIKLLKNPSRSDILKELHDLRKNLNESDNLLIFYAGHGFWDKDIQQGYWLPADAQYDDVSNWISNSDIRDYIKGIKTKHTLLISDACFSGGIFKTREPSEKSDFSLEKTYQYVSRRAITSGTEKTVPDKSVFIEYLLKRLQNNNEKYLTSQQLYMNMKEAVSNNSPLNQTPQYGIIQETGDEGPGDFIFIKK